MKTVKAYQFENGPIELTRAMAFHEWCLLIKVDAKFPSSSDDRTAFMRGIQWSAKKVGNK